MICIHGIMSIQNTHSATRARFMPAIMTPLCKTRPNRPTPAETPYSITPLRAPCAEALRWDLLYPPREIQISWRW